MICLQEQEEGSDEGEGVGTGMGQGQGREDVSEEIENEGQMEGLQGEENNDPQQKRDPKSRGIEMEQVEPIIIFYANLTPSRTLRES